MSLKILHVLDHSVPLHSGYSFRTLAILREQRAIGWETAQLTSPKHYGATADEEDCEGFHFFRTRVPTGGHRSWPVAGQLAIIRDTRRRLADVITRVGPDVVHAHSPCLLGIAAIREARRHRIPMVYEMRASWEDAAVDHGTTTEGSLRYRMSRALESWVLRNADSVTTICEGLRRDILARGVEQHRINVIPNAVDVGEFKYITQADRDLQVSLGLDGAITLGFIGSFYGYEGLDVLLDALPGIVHRQPRVKVLLVGGGYEEARLKAQAKQLGVADRVVFAGRVPHAEVTRYYSIIDLLVYPRKSIKLTETVTPLKPLEAMAQGRVLAASRVGGHRELITDGETGFLFEPGRPQDLADAVNRALASVSRWDAMRAAGRRFVEQERNWRNSVSKYEAVYAEARSQAVANWRCR